MGYNLEKKKKGTNYWSLVNQGGPITGIQRILYDKLWAYIGSSVVHHLKSLIPFLTDTKYAVQGVVDGAPYEFRVSAINLSGAGDPSFPCDTVIAQDPLGKSVQKLLHFVFSENSYAL